MCCTINRIVQAERYAAEIPVELIPDDNSWEPYLSMDDALERERVPEAQAKDDIIAASRGKGFRPEADLGVTGVRRPPGYGLSA